ncbi:MAG: hypothetical protein IT460_10720 [Planctomycetes bacterium]|nr:hypothetical protein [Planctomycetota bacterium]
MAEPRDFTPYQQRVIRRYYQNQDQLREQSLADLVSDLYLATTDKKRDALWKRARTLMEGLGVPAETIERVAAARDAKALAELSTQTFRRDRREEWRDDARDSRSG